MVLIINTGSSSIKMALIDMPAERLLAEGLADRLGGPEASLNWKINAEAHSFALTSGKHLAAMQQMLETLFDRIDKDDITAVGHRVVHGGERFIAPTLLDADVIAEIEAISHLAPLHNPANLLGIRAAMNALPNIDHIAVFDTAFHHAMPQYASLYAVPYDWYSQYGVRRYGFHGTSHHYVGLEAAKCLGREFSDCNILTAHLGNGCSATAIAGGVSIDTTMGMTPLEGLVMGTRSGDVDPGLHAFIAGQSGKSLQEITDILNKESGLLGLSGRSNDMRVLLETAASGEEKAALAIDIFCYRLAKSMAALAVPLKHIHAIVFTGGIGEHASAIRAKTVQQLTILGATLDKQRNDQHGKQSQGFISPDDATLPVLVIAANEEMMIARYVCEVQNRKEQALIA